MTKKKEPSKLDKVDIATPILIASFHNGLNITQACLQSGISREAYRLKCAAEPDFLAKMELARQFVSMKARQNIIDVIEKGNVEQSRWWLERKDKEEFATRQEVTGKDGKPFNEPLSPEAKSKLDDIFSAKKKNESKGNEQPADQPANPADGGAEGESLPS